MADRFIAAVALVLLGVAAGVVGFETACRKLDQLACRVAVRVLVWRQRKGARK